MGSFTKKRRGKKPNNQNNGAEGDGDGSDVDQAEDGQTGEEKPTGGDQKRVKVDRGVSEALLNRSSRVTSSSSDKGKTPKAPKSSGRRKSLPTPVHDRPGPPGTPESAHRPPPRNRAMMSPIAPMKQGMIYIYIVGRVCARIR